MTKEVIVKIKGKQCYPEGETAETVTEVAGEYFLRNGIRYVIFEETEVGFTQSTKSMLKVRDNQVELTKKGLIQSNMVFEEGKQYATEYRTPFGMVPMEVKTEHIRIREEEDSFQVQISYELHSNEALLAECDIQIEVKSRI